MSQALSEVTGVTGQCIIRAMVAGERAPRRLAALRNSRWKKAADAIALALTGTWRAAQLCVLTPALALGDCSTAQLSACDAQIERTCAVLQPRCAPAPQAPAPGEATTPSRRTPHSQSKNAPEVNTRAHSLRITGVDLVAVHGISDARAQTMLAEVGTDMAKWPDDTHFCSWLGLAPKNDLSGGTVLKSRTMKHRNRAAQAFRMAAPSVIRADGACGAFYRRLQGRLGPAQALVATAHTMARTVYHMRKDRVSSHDIGAAEYNQRFRERELKYLQKKAAKLGSTLSLASPITPQSELFLSKRLLGNPASVHYRFPCPPQQGTPVIAEQTEDTKAYQGERSWFGDRLDVKFNEVIVAVPGCETGSGAPENAPWGVNGRFACIIREHGDWVIIDKQ